MAVRKTVNFAPEHLDVRELVRLQGGEALVLLPDTLSPVDGQMVAGFRQGAQALRVRAEKEGVPVKVIVPEGAPPGHYSEHAAEWVLAALPRGGRRRRDGEDDGAELEGPNSGRRKLR
jgi:hypothetical protein